MHLRPTSAELPLRGSSLVLVLAMVRLFGRRVGTLEAPVPLRVNTDGYPAIARLALVEEASQQLESWGCSIVAADAGPGGVAHFALDWSQPRALVLGSEAHGVAEEITSDPRTRLCHIPMHSGIESLNAAMAGTIMLFEAQRQRIGDGEEVS